MSSELCPGWAPGLNIPMGECVHCHVQRRDHPKAAQSRASGAVGGITAKEFALADSPIADHPEVISPAASARAVRPEIVFCRSCNQGMGLTGIESGSQAESDYACPKCGMSGPKSKTPTGQVHGDGHERRPQAQEAPTQLAFRDGLSGADPQRPADSAYMEWYGEGKRRRAEDATVVDAADAIEDAEFQDLPPGGGAPEHETVQYADGSSASGSGPLPRVSPDGSPAVDAKEHE